MVFGVQIVTRDKLFYVHFGVRYLCTIYVSIFIFLVKHVDIYESVNIGSMEPVLPLLWKPRDSGIVQITLKAFRM